MGVKLFFIVPIAFICEFIDSSLGMGYGTTLTPILMLMGFEPLQIVPAILFSEFITGTTAAFFHHNLKNVNFELKSQDTKVAVVLSAFSIIGTIISVILAVKLPPKIVKIYIASIVFLMGVFILTTQNRRIRFTWRKIIAVGTLAAFNKGISGGGYGPLAMGGQILSGIGVKNAIGITSLSEAVTCLTGIILYFILKSKIDWTLSLWLAAGAILSVPIAANTLKKATENRVKTAVGIAIVFLGLLATLKVFYPKVF